MSVLIYGASLLAMLGCSALYHLSGVVHRKALLRRLDHAAIFLLIAGTYAPFTLNKLDGYWGVGLFAFTCTVATSGILFKLLRPRAAGRCLDSRLPVAGLDHSCRARFAAIGRLEKDASAPCGGWVSLHGRRAIPYLAQSAVSERGLTRLRSCRCRLSLRGDSQRDGSLGLVCARCPQSRSLDEERHHFQDRTS
jgi:hypothetical protein